MIIQILIEPICEDNIVATVNKLNIRIPGMVIRAALHFRTILEAALLKAVRDMLIKKSIPAEVDSVTLLADGNTIIGADVALLSIDYVKTVQALLPDIHKLLDEKEDPLAANIWAVIDNQDREIVRGALSALCEEQITQIVQIILTERQEKICGEINRMISQKQIPIQVSTLEIREDL